MYLQKICPVIVFLFFFIAYSTSQSVYEQSYSNKVTVVKYKYNNDYYFEKNLGTIDVGYLDGSLNESKETYRTVLEFDLNWIDVNARIDNAYLIISMNQYIYSSYTMKIRKYMHNPDSQSEEEIWNSVNSSTTYYGSVRYDISDPLPENEDLKNAIDSVLSGDKILRIGILSNKESSNQSHASVFEAKLHIDYSRKISVTVQNSFGKGKIKVDDTQYSHGKTFTDWYEGDEHKFENWDQSYDGVNYVFQNKWTNVTTGQVYNGNPAFISFSADATLRAEFKQKIHITVKNRHNGGQLSVDGDTYDSGAEFDFWKNSKHNFESWEQNYGGFDMKFKDGVKWKMTEKTYNTALVENHEVSTPGYYIAQLYQQYNYTADNSFIDGGSGGTIKINGETKIIPAPDPYAGTTLEEDPFTVEAPPQSQTVNGRSIKYNFIEWENGSTNNPRSINPDNHFDIAATYKGNMVSTTSLATGYNNGRRMVRDDNGKLHMVYEDNGEIWYTSSTNDGSSWQKEVRLSDGYGNNHYPSIAIGYLNKYHVVWLQIWEGWSKEIVYKKEGHNTEILGETTKSAVYPVVTANRLFDFAMVVWNDGTNLKFRVYTDEWEEWSSARSVPNTNSSCIYPTIANDGSSSYATHLAWQKNNEIYYQNMHYLLEENFMWRHYKCVSDVQSLNENEYPSIAVRKIDRKPVIVWQSFDASQEEIDKLIVYRKKSSTSNSNWGTISEFSVTDRESLMPSVATYLNENYNDATIVWHTDNKKLMKVNKRNGSWQNITQIASDSRYANISYRYNGTNNTSYDNILTWTKYHTSPYFVKTEEAGNSVLGKSSSSSNSEISRSEEFKLDLFVDAKASVTDNLGTFLFDLNYPESAYPVTFETVNDTLISRSFFRSGNFNADDYIKLPYQIFVNNINQKSLEKYLKSFPSYLLKIVLRESNSGSVIETLATITIDDLYDAILKGDKLISEVVYITTSKYPGSKVYLDVLANITRSKEYKPIRIVSFGDNVKDISEEAAQKSSSKPSGLVRSYNLSANYPNPFNPQTTITYDIPKDGHVKLVVYNVEGRAVATLVNGFKPKGRYLVVFDGTHLSSGIYFYRLNAGSFTDTKRMLLVK